MSSTTYFFYDPTGRLLAETVPASGSGKDYLYLLDAPIGRVDWTTEQALGDVLRVSKNDPNVHLDWTLYPAGSNTYVVRRKQVVDPNDKTFDGATAIATVTDPTRTYDDPVLNDGNDYNYRVFRRELSESLLFYDTDHLGTPIVMTGGAASFVWRAEHAPFGTVVSLPVSDVLNNVRYEGQYADIETGLHENWYRSYRPATGRYDEPDPLGIVSDEFHVYVYASSNPVNLVDPLGLTTFVGFPTDKERALRNAVEIVRQKLADQPCCVGGGAPKLQQLLDRATFLYREGLRSKGQLLCGEVGFIDWFKRRIKLGAIAFESSKCGALECTVLHEVIHLRIRNAGETSAYAAEKKCFGCGTGAPPK